MYTSLTLTRQNPTFILTCTLPHPQYMYTQMPNSVHCVRYLIAAQILVFHKRQEVVVKELNRAPLVAVQPNLVNYGTEILEKRQNIKILKHLVKYQ